jgi:hypothetical protein
MRIIKESIGLPINIFFVRNRSGTLRVFFNGQRIPPMRDLFNAARALDGVVRMGKKKIGALNEKIDRDIARQIEQSRNTPDRKKNPTPGYVYLVRSVDLYKIGRCKDRSRVKAYTTENPHGAEVLKMVPVRDCVATEKALLKKFVANKYRGEWFRFTKKELRSVLAAFTMWDKIYEV